MTTPPPPKETEQVNFSDGSTRTLTQFRCPKYSCSKPEPKEPSQHQQPFASRAWAYLNEDVRPSHFAEMQLVLLTFCIGLQDFHAFASNQTGNTVFLMLAIALPQFNPSMFITANIGCSLGFFLGSAWLTGQLGHIIGPRRRLWLLVTNTIQTCLVFIAAALQFGSHHTNTPGKDLFESGSLDGWDAVTGTRTLICIALLASAAGSQVVLSRSLNMTEITTAMATAAWLDLVIDKNMFRSLKKNKGRNRRMAFLTALAVGSLCGAYIYREVGSAVVITISGGGKAVVLGMFLCAPGEKVKKGDEERGNVNEKEGKVKSNVMAKEGAGAVKGGDGNGSGSGSGSDEEVEVERRGPGRGDEAV
ncbi:unnamed protein product [Sordaria macrospora k-hell]|uniref:WGS project CABT00000000 data, contig 2.1 n=1 Tax=Sordaria macrospora (strain ATCC MYA-333 / DSM 997 / K(L3346) / K-hell) TaxID=771870 RepID=F7VLW9_SORMK|nr:uncharacterized protein SMAC_04890 [Sordaria macrospora k-hell]CCC06497.1 unnamed protein product [Sordaria macrospora k-hell]